MRGCVVLLCLLVCSGCGSTGDVSQPGIPVGWMDREDLADPVHGDFALVYDTSRMKGSILSCFSVHGVRIPDAKSRGF